MGIEMIWSCGIWTVREGRDAEFVDAWREFAQWSQTQFGGARAWLLRDRAAARTYMTVGPWPDEETIEAWRSSPGFRDRVGAIRSLVEAFEPRTYDEVTSVG
jgi:heme-degrading monooxygenase HmoA